MQRFLSLSNSEKGSPNENFARELLELFTLGMGNYTEKDIKEIARALTGFTYDWETERFGYDPDRHDGGGQAHPRPRRPLHAAGRGRHRDRPQGPRPPFLVEQAVGLPQPAAVPAEAGPGLAREDLREAPHTDVWPVLREILNNKLFYAGLAEPDMVKLPFVDVGRMLRLTNGRVGRRGVAVAPRPDGPGPVPPAERERLGGRHRVALDELHPGPLRRRASAVLYYRR